MLIPAQASAIASTHLGVLGSQKPVVKTRLEKERYDRK